MKDGFRLFEIEPLEDTLDFMGPTQSSESVKLLEGIVRLSLTRPTKIRSIAVKFKGFGRVTIQGKSNNSVGLVTPMLPKLKCCISGKTLLPAGDHTIPWDLEIPNIYPPSLLIKRATIFYRVEVVISFALAKSISAEHPITLRRHLLPCKELAPLVETKIYEHTVPAKFHYEIEAPQIICLDQLVLPFAVKYLCIANQKAVQSIRTQLTQIELYRVQSVSKTDANLTQAPMDVYNLEKKVSDCKQRRDYAKFVKRTIPALIHSVDQTRSSAWKQPIVLRHKLHQFLQYSFDSPLVSVHHQLEVTFQFDHRFEDIKAKVPIIIASIPSPASASALASSLALPPQSALSPASASIITSTKASQQQQQQQLNEFWLSVSDSDSKYPFESVTRLESMAVVPEKPDWPTRRASEDLHSRGCVSSLVIDPTFPETSLDQTCPPIKQQHQPRQQKQPSSNNTTTTDHPLWSSALRLPQSTTVILKNKVAAATGTKATGKFFGGRKSSDGFSDKHRLPLLYRYTNEPSSSSSSTNANLFGRKKSSIKRYNSDYDLNALADDIPDDTPQDPPRKSTPAQRRHTEDKGKQGNGDRRRHVLPPIDVDLANGIKSKTLPKLVDRSKIKQAPNSIPNSNRAITRSGSSCDMAHLGGTYESDNGNDSSDDDDEDDFDFQSVYSDLSLTSPVALPSATESSDQHTLLTRPPSPSYRPALGLPANTALRSHEEQPSSLVEETFNYAAISSPVIATVASSIMLSPSISNASSTATASTTTRRRIALSSVSSIMNGSNGDAMSFRSFGNSYQHHRISNGSGIIPIPTATTRNPYSSALRESAALEPDDYHFGLLDNAVEETSNNNNNTAQPSAQTVDPKQHYLHAKLPPIPGTTALSVSSSSLSLVEAASGTALPTPIASPYPLVGAVVPRIRKNKPISSSSNGSSSNKQEASPTVLNDTKRMTRLYVDDSDDETLDPLPPIPEKQQSCGPDPMGAGHPLRTPTSTSTPAYITNSSVQEWANALLDNVAAPVPQLPRLSFGMALGDALGFDHQFPNGN